MANDNVLVEKEFDISLDGKTHKVKAAAVFLVHGAEPKEVGIYFLDFTLGGQTVESTQLDKTYYAREEARRAAESAFSSGEVEAYVKSQIQSWINLVNGYEVGIRFLAYACPMSTPTRHLEQTHARQTL